MGTGLAMASIGAHGRRRQYVHPPTGTRTQ
jgi:hypothetical protein